MTFSSHFLINCGNGTVLSSDSETKSWLLHRFTFRCTFRFLVFLWMSSWYSRVKLKMSVKNSIYQIWTKWMASHLSCLLLQGTLQGPTYTRVSTLHFRFWDKNLTATLTLFITKGTLLNGLKGTHHNKKQLTWHFKNNDTVHGSKTEKVIN